MRKRNKLGKVFGVWEVIAGAPNKGKHVAWRCRCVKCGHEQDLYSTSLKQAGGAGCQRCRRRPDLTGTAVGQLSVLQRSDDRESYLCRCACGQESTKSASELHRKNPVQSCGCLVGLHLKKPRERVPPLECAQNAVIHDYRRSANLRGYTYSITSDEALALFGADCNYCGAPPSNTRTYRGTPFHYNGIDRIDNAVGYEPGNVTTCCAACNRAKDDRSQEEFIAWTTNVVQRHQLMTKITSA